MLAKEKSNDLATRLVRGDDGDWRRGLVPAESGEDGGRSDDRWYWWLWAAIWVMALGILAVLIMMLRSPEEFSEVALSTGVFVACVIAYQFRARLGSPVVPITA
jgi:hypothetical protein